MNDSFSKLARDGRWLSSSEQVGGRAVDILQIAYSLRHAIKDAYDINEVPAAILVRLNALTTTLERGEREIADLIEAVSADRLRLQEAAGVSRG
jgi:hypothetical protein